jgi:hypothetical protein
VGYVLTVTAFLLYTRHVIREIEGLVVMPPAKPHRSKKKPADEPSKPAEARTKHEPSRTDLDPVAVTAPRSFSQPSRTVAPCDDEEDDSSRADEPGRLSRAERRRLRREARRSA